MTYGCGAPDCEACTPLVNRSELPECFWGQTNGHGDCVPVEGDTIDGNKFCELHTDILFEYDEDERKYTLAMLEDSQR